MSERHQRLRAVFEAALLEDPAARDAFLAQACAEDTELRQHVLRLLAARQGASDFLEHPVEIVHSGSTQEAVTAAERALAMLPPLPPGVKSTGLRNEIEGHLAQFRGRR